MQLNTQLVDIKIYITLLDASINLQNESSITNYRKIGSPLSDVK